jgi:phosphopantothenoylcysteine decarboxylase/phosphopantothenate--cysteine ligase
VLPVVSTEEMLATCQRVFPHCDGLIGVAAPCDYRPEKVEQHKIKKTGDPLLLQLIETPDIVATLGATKRPEQWLVGFALETEDQRFRAITKMQKKSCDLMVLNGPQAISAAENCVEVLDRSGEVISSMTGPKESVAAELFRLIAARLISKSV